MNLKEIGTLQDKPEYKLIDGDYPDSYIAKFTLDGNDIEVFLSNNPLSVLPQIDSIYNTNYKEEYIDSYSEDFIENLPPKFQKVGSIDFRVNDKSDIPKIRQQNNINPNIEYNQLVQDNQNIINQATRYGFRNVNDALRSENNNPLLYKLVIQNRRLFQKLNDLSRQIPTYKELPKEEPNIKFYIQALNQSISIARDFFNKTKPNIIIVNFPSELPDEITQKRNNIYRQYIEKYLSQDYNIKEKNGILYLEKQGLQEMNEIKRMQKLAGILTEIVVNNPTIKKLKATIIEDENEDEDFLYINYSDINVEGSIQINEDIAVSTFDSGDNDDMVNFTKLIELLKESNIKDYKIHLEDGPGIHNIIIPLSNIKFE